MDEAFLLSMASGSNDPVNWLVYSDWLEEQGRHKEASWCRDVASRMIPYKETKLVVRVTTYDKSRSNDRYVVAVEKDGKVTVKGDLNSNRVRPVRYAAMFACWASFGTLPIHPLKGRLGSKQVRTVLWRHAFVGRCPTLLSHLVQIALNDRVIQVFSGTNLLWSVPLNLIKRPR